MSVARGPGTLWRSDGTAAGTFALPQARPSFLWSVGRRVLCAASDALGAAVYVSDGTLAGTLRLAGAIAQVAAGGPGGVWFGSQDSGELWFSDLTPRGTRKLGAELAPRSLAATAAGDVVATANESVWHVTRTGEATLLHASPRRIDSGSLPREMVSAGTFALGTARVGGRDRVFRTDGTARGTWLTAANLGASAQPVGVALGRVLLAGPSGGVGTRLFAHDGGTGPAIDLLPTSAGLASPLVVPRQGRALFIAADPRYGEEPWITDGTPGGTGLLLDITPGPTNTSRRAPIVIDDHRFALPTDDDRFLIWSDGTAAGTRRLAMPAFGPPRTFAACRGSGRLLVGWSGALAACDGQSFTPLVPGVWGLQLFEFAGQVWFVDTATGSLWRSDGTNAGTVPALALPTSTAALHAIWRGGLVLSDAQFTLWWTDGTAAGTRVLLSSLSSPTEVIVWGDDMLVVRQDRTATGALGSMLWLVRGDGTQQLVSMHTGPYSSMVVPVSGRLVFAHDDGLRGNELWGFDPGAAATEVASGCGGPARLRASAPRLGARLAVRGETAAGTFAAALWLGLPLRPMPHGAGCALAGDFAVLAEAFPLYSPQFVRALPIPSANALLGTEWMLQAMLALPRGPELSHGVHLRVGR